MSKTFVIGDIHGGLKGLVQVLAKAAISANDALIFLGDYVDGWSESAQTIEFLINLSKNQPCIFIKGNHDEWCEEWLRNGRGDEVWLFHGGLATLNSYEGVEDKIRQEHLKFFGQLKSYYIDEQNRLFVHAGFTSVHGPEHEKNPANFSWDRTLWETAVRTNKRRDKNSIFYPKRLKLFNEIYIGHTPTLYYNESEPMKRCNVWNVDTGAAFTGRLTIMNPDTKQFWQSDAVKDLYPGEKGRNHND